MSSAIQTRPSGTLSPDTPAASARFPILRGAWVFAKIGTLFTAVSIAMTIVSLCTLFRARRFCSEVLGTWLGKSALKACGVEIELHGETKHPAGQTVFVINHTSVLDVFILLALGLPGTRFFLWGGLRKFPPVAIMGYITGVFFTPTQARPDKRARCFQNAERILRRTGESVLLSPEGRCVTIGGISRFNKGAFHLATNLKAPIVPIFISIPRHIDPGRGYAAMPGVVHVYFNAPIPTSDWKVEDLARNKEMVRDLYVEWNGRLRLP
jgi:1-acyl-sn-glycerol-3-phosphate acyltransferase